MRSVGKTKAIRHSSPAPANVSNGLFARGEGVNVVEKLVSAISRTCKDNRCASKHAIEKAFVEPTDLSATLAILSSCARRSRSTAALRKRHGHQCQLMWVEYSRSVHLHFKRSPFALCKLCLKKSLELLSRMISTFDKAYSPVDFASKHACVCAHTPCSLSAPGDVQCGVSSLSFSSACSSQGVICKHPRPLLHKARRKPREAIPLCNT